MSDLATLLPPNSGKAEETLEQLSGRLTNVTAPVRALWNPETCPDHLLPYLAWAFSVDVWDASWPAARKRRVIRRAINVHRHKGTRAAVEAALTSIDADTQIIEWWETAAQPGAEPSTFEIWLDLASVLADGIDLSAVVSQMRDVVDATKPVSAHYTAHARIAPRAREYAGATSVVSGRVGNRAGIPDAPIIAATFRSGVMSKASGHLQTPVMEAP